MLAKLAVLIIKLYQRLISPRLPAACKYHPTCSHYAVEALQKHGFIRGSIMAVWRVLRCNPFSKGGYDPVPPSRKEQNEKKSASAVH